MDQQEKRASDAEREEVVSRLRVALDEGRIKMDEYLDRMGKAYEAVTRGELALLQEDLPEPAGESRPAETQDSAFPSPDFGDQGPQLRVLRTVWLIAVSVNVVVWGLVSATTDKLIYPWPLWVAGPLGVVILILSARQRAMRRQDESPAKRRLPRGD